MVIGRQIQEAAKRYGSRRVLTSLVTDGGKTLEVVEEFSFAELYECTLRLASALATKGLVKGDRLAVLLDNCAAMVMSEWACLKTGLLWVSLNTRSSPSELTFMLEDSRPSMLLVGENKLSLLEGVDIPPGCELVTVGGSGDGWGALLRAGEATEPGDELREEDPVRIRYTSGTAGKPKGAVLPRRCYDASVEAVTALLRPMADDEVVLQVAPMTHASGAMLLPHLLVGGRAVLVDRFDASAFEGLVERFRTSSVFLVPTMLVRVLEALERPRALGSLRRIVYGGSPMPVERLKRGLEALGPVFIQIYGLTESTWPVSALSREDHRLAMGDEALLARLKSCGKPTAIGEVKVVGEDGRCVAAGLPGEILVR
ncbi:MAG: class I adenylate-forming enzyme family protein, partial [Candidatus Binatia bacterium]